MKPWNIGHNGMGSIVKYPKNFHMGKGSTYNDRCWINARYGVHIGENVLIGPYVIIQTVNHVVKAFDVEQNANDAQSWCGGDRAARVTGAEVTIGNDVWIGANVTILAGTKIPEKCVIGAGVVLTKSRAERLRPGDVVVGEVPLRVLYNRKDVE